MGLHSCIVLIIILPALTSIADSYGPHFELKSLSVAQVLDNIRSGVSCKDVIEFFTKRIDLFDRKGPNLNAVIMKNPDAKISAQDLDQFYLDKNQLKGSLHCVPVLVKDIIPVKGMPTTFGNKVSEKYHCSVEAFCITPWGQRKMREKQHNSLNYFLHSVSEDDAFAVKRLKEEGAIVIGTANLKIFATSGFVDASETGGLERNPYAPSYTVYGSSSGNAAGQAARYSVLGLGTDTAGSVLGPASAANLLGFRPAVGMYSSDGVMPVNPHSDTIAPLTFNAQDLGIILDILTQQSHPFYRVFDSRDRKPKIGIITELIFGTFNLSSAGTVSEYSLEAEVSRITENAVFYLWKLGYTFHNASPNVPERIQSALNGFTHFYDCIPHHIDEFLSKSDPRPDAPQGLPLSLIIMSKPENVKLILQVANDFEMAFGHQVMPQYMKRYASGILKSNVKDGFHCCSPIIVLIFLYARNWAFRIGFC